MKGMILFIIGLRQNLATSRLTNISSKIVILYDSESIYEILLCHGACGVNTKYVVLKTYIFRISAKVKVILLASRNQITY